jgi:hypothetical protein
VLLLVLLCWSCLWLCIFCGCRRVLELDFRCCLGRSITHSLAALIRIEVGVHWLTFRFSSPTPPSQSVRVLGIELNRTVSRGAVHGGLLLKRRFLQSRFIAAIAVH